MIDGEEGDEANREMLIVKSRWLDIPGGPVLKNLPASAGNMGLIPGLGRCHRPGDSKAHEPPLLCPKPGGHAPQQEEPPR